MPYLVRILILLPLAVYCGRGAYAQTYHLDGYMGVQGGESFHYEMILSDSTGNLLSGYAYTYKEQNHDVKAYVTALVNREEKTLHIQEQQIIYNHGFESKATICLVNALLKWSREENSLSGSLMTQTSNNGLLCSTGSIVLIKKDQIQNLFSPPPPKPKATATPFPLKEDPNKKLHTYFKQKEKQEAAAQQATTARKKEEQTATEEIKLITEGKEGIYEWHSSTVVLEIWDGGTIDNDQVTITFNGKEVLKSYELKAEKKQLTFNLNGNELNIITITANNEGANPPNTANITLRDGELSYAILAHNKTGKSAIIRIRKAP